MSIASKSLMTIAAALASNQVRSIISKVELDDILQPIGLARRRVHWGSSFVLLGVGIAVGGSAALLLSPSTGREIRKRVSARFKDLRQEIEADNDQGETKERVHENHQPGGLHVNG